MEPIWVMGELRKQISQRREYNRMKINASGDNVEKYRKLYLKEKVRGIIQEKKNMKRK